MNLIIAILIVLLLNSFFAGFEIGVISLLRPRIHHEAAKGVTGARILEDIIAKPQLMLATTLFGNNICTVLVSVLTDQLFGEWGMTGSLSLLCSTLVVTLLLMLSEIIPKNWFRQSPEKRCIFYAPLYWGLGIILYPGAMIMALFTSLTIRIFAGSKSDNARAGHLLRQDFRLLLRDSEAAGTIDSAAADLLDKAVDFNNLKIRNIYIPAEKLITIKPNISLNEALAICRANGKSRLPVINEAGEWEGFFSLYDAIYNIPDDQWDYKKVSGCMRTTTTVKLNDPLNQVLHSAKQMNTRMIFVEDEKERIVGAVTPTDVSRALFNH